MKFRTTRSGVRLYLGKDESYFYNLFMRRRYVKKEKKEMIQVQLFRHAGGEEKPEWPYGSVMLTLDAFRRFIVEVCVKLLKEEKHILVGDLETALYHIDRVDRKLLRQIKV